MYNAVDHEVSPQMKGAPMTEEHQKNMDEQKLKSSRLVRKAERKMLNDYRDKLRILLGILSSAREGYLGLLSRTKQDIESQITSLSTHLKQRIRRLNSGWPNSDIREAKANELRPGKKLQKTTDPKEELDSKAFVPQKTPISQKDDR